MLSHLRPVVITICVDYWDYLEHTLPHTLRFASRVYLATSENETPPDWVSQHRNVVIVPTAAFRKGVFNKAGAIRHVQELVHAAHPDEWVLLLDADIIADPGLCHDTQCTQALYSVNRMDYDTPEDRRKGNGTPYHTPGAGYFQLYFDKTKLYPEYSEDASECDMDFYRAFQSRVILGGMVEHLGRHTVNWRGRTSAQWNAV